MSDDNSTPTPHPHRDKRQRLTQSPQSAHSSSISEDFNMDTDADDFYEQVDHAIKEDSWIQRLRAQYPNGLPEGHHNKVWFIITESLLWQLEKSNHDLFQQRAHMSTFALAQLLHDQLGEILPDCWNSGSYGSILEQSFELLYNDSPKPIKPGKVSDESDEEVQLIIERAWNVPYQGNYHEILLYNLNDKVKREAYMNICAIVQSSGTGKSRMVDEQAKLVYTLPINIRRKKGIYAAYPPPDESLHNYLVNIGADEDCQMHYMEFFRSLFYRAAAELDQVNAQGQSETEFAEMWREKMKNTTYRNDFYVKVVDSCRVHETPVDKKQRTALKREALVALLQLSEVLDQHFESANQIKIMIYIDEAHELRQMCGFKGKRHTQLSILCSVIADFHQQPLCCILLSTRPSLRFLAPPARAASSERAEEKGDILLAPITETPFDCAPNFTLVPATLRLEDVSKIEYLAQWGRPLWWSMFDKAKETDPGFSAQTLIRTARIKLLRQHDIDNIAHKNISLAQATAILDVLLTLDFEPTREMIHDKWPTVLANEAEMVANNMRIAYSVPQNRTYMRSGYPSEPILAEAAAQQLHSFQSQPGLGVSNVMVDLLRQNMDRSWVNLGERGEIAMRVLLMRAYMNGVLVDHASAPPLVFSRGCGFITFIEQLFTPKRANKILDSKPHNIMSDSAFRDEFKDSVVRFTHFAKAGDGSAFTTQALFVAFARGMAFICCQNQDKVDLVIPILLNKSDTLQPSAMSAMLIQVKRRIDTRGGMAYAFSQKDVGLFSVADEDSRPYFILIAELHKKGKDEGDGENKAEGKAEAEGKGMGMGMGTAKGKGKGTASGSGSGTASGSGSGTRKGKGTRTGKGKGTADDQAEGDGDDDKGKGKDLDEEAEEAQEMFIPEQPQRQSHPPDTHPCFLATVWGCSKTLYKENAAEYRHLLAFGDFLKEHPHQNAQSRTTVMKLKPIWEYGKDSYHFIEDDILHDTK